MHFVDIPLRHCVVWNSAGLNCLLYTCFIGRQYRCFKGPQEARVGKEILRTNKYGIFNIKLFTVSSMTAFLQ